MLAQLFTQLLTVILLLVVFLTKKTSLTISVLGAYCYARELDSLVEQATYEQKMNLDELAKREPNVIMTLFYHLPSCIEKSNKKEAMDNTCARA